MGLLANITLPTGALPLEPLWHEAYQADLKPNQILKALDQGDRHSRLASLAECARDGNYLKFRNRLYVPNYEPLILSLIQAAHDSPSAGHPGRAKTHELLSRWYVWPGMRRDIGRYVANCHTCQRSRTSRHAPFGILRPLPIPDRPWEHVSMDFVTGLPWSEGNDAILVVVDQLSKMRHLVSCRTMIDTPTLAELYLRHI